MKTVGQLLASKPSHLISIDPNSSVYEALKLMVEKDIGSLLVLESNKLVGIFTERDYARKLVLQGKSSYDTLVGEVMSTHLTAVKTDNTLADCMEIMTIERFRHLPVMQDGEVIGLLSIGDLVKELLTIHEETIQQLQTYINS